MRSGSACYKSSGSVFMRETVTTVTCLVSRDLEKVTAQDSEDKDRSTVTEKVRRHRAHAQLAKQRGCYYVQDLVSEEDSLVSSGNSQRYTV